MTEIEEKNKEVEEQVKKLEEELKEPNGIAMYAYNMYLSSFKDAVENMSGNAAKRVLKGLVEDPLASVLPKHTSDIEKSAFMLASRLLDAKYVLILNDMAEKEKQKQTQENEVNV